MVPSEVERMISSFMSRTFLFEFGHDASPDTDLFEAGLIDSFGFVELVGFLEGTFGVKFSEVDLQSVEIATLSGITRMIVDRLPTAAS